MSARHRWRSVLVLAAACGLCLLTPTLAGARRAPEALVRLEELTRSAVAQVRDAVVTVNALNRAPPAGPGPLPWFGAPSSTHTSSSSLYTIHPTPPL